MVGEDGEGSSAGASGRWFEGAGWGARRKTGFALRWVWGHPAGWDKGESSGQSEGEERGVHPLFPAILTVGGTGGLVVELVLGEDGLGISMSRVL